MAAERKVKSQIGDALKQRHLSRLESRNLTIHLSCVFITHACLSQKSSHNMLDPQRSNVRISLRDNTQKSQNSGSAAAHLSSTNEQQRLASDISHADRSSDFIVNCIMETV